MGTLILGCIYLGIGYLSYLGVRRIYQSFVTLFENNDFHVDM